VVEWGIHRAARERPWTTWMYSKKTKSLLLCLALRHYLARLRCQCTWQHWRRCMNVTHDGGTPHRCVIKAPCAGIWRWQRIPSVICSCRAKLGLCRRLYQPPQGPPAPQRPLVVFVQPRVQSKCAAVENLNYIRFQGEKETVQAL
jgi:hypothetical protein